MAALNVQEEQIRQLARQLDADGQRRLALELLCGNTPPPRLAELHRDSWPRLAAAFRKRGLDIGRLSADQIDEAIQQIVEET